MFKVRFDIMDKLSVLDRNSAYTIICINLENVFKTILTSRINNYYIASKTPNELKLELMSNIINLAQHYNLYCAKVKQKAKIVLYWNYPNAPYRNNKYIELYKDYYSNRMFNSMDCGYIMKCIHECHNFMKTMCKYVNNVYIIDATEIDSSVVPMIIKNNKFDMKNTQYLLVSNSKYDYQYVNLGFDIICPRGKDSVLLNTTNVVDYLKSINNIKTKLTMSPNHIPFALSLIGDKYRCIPKMNGVGLSTVISCISKAVDNLMITDNTTNVDMLASILSESFRHQFTINYKCTDILSQYNEASASNIDDVVSQVCDKYDTNSLDYINDKYFRQYPIMIVRSIYEVI